MRRCKNPECGKEFIASNIGRMYCSERCLDRHHKQKHRDESYYGNPNAGRPLAPEKVAELRQRLLTPQRVPLVTLAPIRPQVTRRDEEWQEHVLQGRYGKIVSVTQGAATCSGCRRLLQPGRSCRCGYQEEVGE